MCAAVSMSGTGVGGEILGRCYFIFRCYYISTFFETNYASTAEGQPFHDVATPVICNHMLHKFHELGDEVFEVRSNMARIGNKNGSSKKKKKNIKNKKKSSKGAKNASAGAQGSASTTAAGSSRNGSTNANGAVTRSQSKYPKREMRSWDACDDEDNECVETKYKWHMKEDQKSAWVANFSCDSQGE